MFTYLHFEAGGHPHFLYLINYFLNLYKWIGFSLCILCTTEFMSLLWYNLWCFLVQLIWSKWIWKHSFPKKQVPEGYSPPSVSWKSFLILPCTTQKYCIHMSIWTEKQMVSLDGNYENENKYFILLKIFASFKGFFSVASPKCAFYTGRRNWEDIINVM